VNLEINKKINGKNAFLTIHGEVDMYSSPLLRKEVMKIANQKIENILIDLQDVNYMDSSGVATLIEGLQLCKKYGGTILLAGMQDNVREVFELTRLDKIFKIYNNVTTAKAELQK